MKSRRAGAERVAKVRKLARPEKTDQPVRADLKRLQTAVCIFLALATVFVYCQTFRYGFIAYDDDQYVYENPMVKAGLTASGVAWAVSTFHYANWHPLTWISYLLDAQLFGMNAGAFHLVNVLLHAASAVLLFLALFRMTRRPWRCAVVAAVFALHPLHVESVAWISERKDVLSTFLEMIALLLYARYVEHPTTKRYLLVSLTFALSVMAKPMLVTFPLVLLLLDYWPLRRIQWPPRWPKDRPVLVEKAPLLLISLAASVLTFVAQRNYGAVASLEHVPLATRIANAATAYVTYIKQALWPADLGALYPTAPPALGSTGLALLVLLVVTAAALIFARMRPYLFTGWFWYLGMLVPVIGIVQVGAQSRADRYMYVPLVGLTIAIIWAAADWLELHPALQHAAAAAVGAVLLVFAAGTWHQAGYWKDSRTLFEHTLAITERNYIIRNNLGVILARDGDAKGAMDQYRQAIAINPEYAEAHANLGHVLLRAGQFEAARSQLLEALRLKPSFAMAHADLGVLNAAGGNYQEAIGHLSESLRLDPDDAEAHSNLCFVLQHAGRVDEAIVHCREALRLRPDFPSAEYNLKNALAARQ
jgi:tetratricopeptide (TPR) repeat protein